MLIIWGSRSRQKQELSGLSLACLLCQEPGMSLVSSRTWFTFFFIPLFPISSKKYYVTCASCENCFKIKDESVNQLKHAMNQQQGPSEHSE